MGVGGDQALGDPIVGEELLGVPGILTGDAVCFLKHFQRQSCGAGIEIETAGHDESPKKRLKTQNSRLARANVKRRIFRENCS